jgi:flagellar biosynthetic protein FliR
MLVLARMIGFFVQAPIWGSKHINQQVLVGFTACVAMVIFPNVALPENLDGNPIIFILLIASQLFIGMVMGYTSFLCMACAQFGGEMLDIQLGLSSAAASDPSSKGTINLIRRLQFYLAMTLYLIFDGHHILMKAAAKSFDIIPLTGTRFSGKLIEELIMLSGKIFYIGVQIALPAMGALFMVQIALGVMARVAPQMNVFMMSFPLNILVGLTILIATIPILARYYGRLFEYNNDWLIRVMQLLIPQ